MKLVRPLNGALERSARDLKYAVRTLRCEPTFVVAVVLTFALAIGTNAAMFGLVARLMLAAPPGIRDADRLSRARFSFLSDDGDSFVASTTSYPTFRLLRAQHDAFAAVAASKPDTMTVGRSPSVSQIAILGASGDYFATLGARPALGRFFADGDDALPDGNSVLVLGYEYWQRAFAGERSALGREIVVNDQPFTIIGVAARGFNGDELAQLDAFMPLTASMRKNDGDWASNPYMNVVSIVVRLRDGVTPAAARQMVSAALRDERSVAGRLRSGGVELVSIIPGRESRQSPQARIALWLAAVSIIVLLIATTNVGTLLSLRSARRQREIAVRIAVGAGHADLARQLLIESVLLAAIGAGVGLLLSHWFSNVIRVTLLPNLAPGEGFVDRRVLLVSIGTACLAGLAAGLAPLSQIRRTNLSAQLRSGGGQGTSGRLAFQNTFVTVQVALCTMLLIGAALFVRSLERVQSQDLGFTAANLLYVTLDFRGYVSGTERDRAYYAAAERIRPLAGVRGTTVAAGIPFGPHNIPPVSIPGMSKPFGPGVQPPIMYGATPEYLDIMGVKLVAGRLFTSADKRGTPQVVLVNESLARGAWPGKSPLGKCVRAGFGVFPPTGEGNPADLAPCREVVGIVRDSRARSLRPEGNEDRLMQYYVPFEQIPDSPRPDPSQVMGLVVRVAGDLDRTSALVQRTIHATSTVPVYARSRPYQDLIDPQLRSWRLGATLFSAFSALALGIAAVGLFGVVSYIVTQRTQEIGVRLALGGTSERVARLVVTDALRMVTIGLAIGVAGALAAGPVVASMLFQTSPHEPASIAQAALVLISATLIAAAWPAWRAGRVNPVVALRADG
ncbi:MAG TPA: ABC transporter permease [Gemmatimonadaceae bacterium]|jgi:predicted permease|nr:ABC transporter permease [Gemmatimonadaceae bacterium]